MVASILGHPTFGRRISTLLWLTCAGVAACSGGKAGSVGFTVGPSTLLTSATRVELYMVSDCVEVASALAVADRPSNPLRTIAVELGSAPQPNVNISPGEYGVYGLAYDDNCAVIAAACQMLQIEASDTPIEITLNAATRAGCDTGTTCTQGQCLTGLDAGVDSGTDAGTRDPLDWPFADDSPWNTPLGTSLVFEEPSAPQTAAITADIPGQPPELRKYNSVYTTSAADPWVTVSYDESNFAPFVDGMIDVRIPVGAVFGPHSMTVMDPLSDESYGIGSVQTVSGGMLQAYKVNNIDLRGPGHGVGGYYQHGGFPSIAGTIRAWEMQALSIRHAVMLILPTAVLSGTSMMWPASTVETMPPSEPFAGLVQVGALVAIPANVDLDGLGLISDEGRALAWTLQHFGAYVGGWTEDAMTFSTEIATDNASIVRLNADLPAIRSVLRVVTNNSPTTVGGPGPRLFDQPLPRLE